MGLARLEDLAVKLFEISAFKFGEFTLKSGTTSPVYFDLRVIVSYPEVMVRYDCLSDAMLGLLFNICLFQDTITDLINEFIVEKSLAYDHLCGVPYTALPLATLISVKAKKPMLIRRKEAKDYGTKKMIEGKFEAGQSCLIIEDVVTSGSSVIETVQSLRAEGLQVTDAIVLVDREQGGASNTADHAIKLHSLFSLSQLLNILSQVGKIDQKMVQKVAAYIKENQAPSLSKSAKSVEEKKRVGMKFEDRANLATNEVSRHLFNLMASKKTNLCLAADLTKAEDIIGLATKAGPHICLLKLHVDIIEDFTQGFIDKLQSIAKLHNFLLMEDRKFADIGNTVALQYTSGLFKIADWADLVTAHSLPGEHVLKGLKALIGGRKDRGVFLLAELSSAGNLIKADYTKATVQIATESADANIVTGIVCQNNIFNQPGLIQLTPGVQLAQGGDELGQQYNTPDYVVKEKGTDIGVVGRGIYRAKDVTAVAENYKNALWAAYCDRVGIPAGN